jgi:hypothetical protein
MTAPSPFDVARGISNNFGEAYGQIRDTNAIGQILNQAAQSGNSNDIDNAMNQILQRVSPQNQQRALGILQNQKNSILQKENQSKVSNAYEKLGLNPEIANLSEGERREFLKNKLTPDLQRENQSKIFAAYQELGLNPQIANLSEGERKEFLKNKFAPEKKEALSPFAKGRASLGAKKFEEAQTLYEKSKQATAGINRIEELNKQLGGLGGYFNALRKGGKATELNALGLAALEPVIKIFNPVGAIPTQKIELLKEKFAPKATDFSATIEGKARALKRISKMSEERALKTMQLYAQYDGAPPVDALLQFNKESEKELDKIIEMDFSEGNENIEMVEMMAPNGRKLSVPNDEKQISFLISKGAKRL